MKKIILFLAIIPNLLGSTFAYALPPKVEAERLMLETKSLLENQQWGRAVENFKKIKSLNTPLVDTFYYHYGLALIGNGEYEEGKTNLDKYISDAGSKGRFYRQALEAYNNAESLIKKNQEQLRADKEKLLRDLAGEFVNLKGRSFSIGKYEVTQDQWFKVMGNNPSSQKCGKCPVDQVSWYEVQEFINKLNSLTDLSFRLPSSDEWLYACSSGDSNGKSCFSEDVFNRAVVRQDSNPKGELKPVGSMKPNRIGIYDMIGNAAEMVYGFYDSKKYALAFGSNSWWGFNGLYDEYTGKYNKFVQLVNIGRKDKEDQIGFRLAISDASPKSFTGKYKTVSNTSSKSPNSQGYWVDGYQLGFSSASGEFLENFADVKSFVNGYAAVKEKNSLWKIIDNDLRTIKFFEGEDANQFDEVGTMQNGLILGYKRGFGWSYYNDKGEHVLPPLKAYQDATERYVDVSAFCDGLAWVETLDSKEIIIDKTGKRVSAKEYPVGAILSKVCEGLFLVKEGGRYGFYNIDGKLGINAYFDGATGFSEGLAGVKVNEKWGVIDKTGKFIIQPKYEDLRNFNEGKAAVKIYGNWGFIDKTGKFIVDPIYEDVGDFSNGLALVYANLKPWLGNNSWSNTGEWRYIDPKGNIILFYER